MPARCNWMTVVLLTWTLTTVAPAERIPDHPDGALWRIAWITDTQTHQCEWMTPLLDRMREERPQMVIHTGDTRFEWANTCAWKDVMDLLRIESPPLEFHLAPGNHDITRGRLKAHLRRAATRGLYRIDTGFRAQNMGHYHDRVPADAAGPLWPVWNPEVVTHPAWQPEAHLSAEPPEGPYRYVFRRGGIRFIVADCYYSDEQRDWIRELIVQPDDSSVSILLQHEHTIDSLAKYFEGLEGRHNVRLVLNGHDHNYRLQERHGVTFITGAGMSEGPHRDSDAMILRVHPDRLQLDRYSMAAGDPMSPIEGPTTIWTCEGSFTSYQRPAHPPVPDGPALPSEPRWQPRTTGPDLIYNGDFNNGIWYERYRGWSPAGWYQWFTCGDHAPEHTVGRDIPLAGPEYVRIHMWAHRWRGGILQNVRDVDPCHWYALRAYGWFARTVENPEPEARIGLEPHGRLREQFAADVTRHPAPPYNECVGADPWPDLPDSTVWSQEHDFATWGRFDVTAEAQSDVVTAILYCNPRQRSAEEPIYEMNWDAVSLHKVPWPAPRLVSNDAALTADERFGDLHLTVQRHLNTAQLTWRTKMPTGASQVLYRFVTGVPGEGEVATEPGRSVDTRDFPFETPVVYERSARERRIEIEALNIPDHAVELHAVALSRAVIDGQCQTLCSPVVRLRVVP